MKLSTKSRYGTKILVDLASQDKNKPVKVGDISKRQGITVKYVEQLLRPLKNEGYVSSVRGARGGYFIAKDPKQITLDQIVKLFESHADIMECINHPDICNISGDCNVRLAWEKVNTSLYNCLESISIDDIATGKIQPVEKQKSRVPQQKKAKK